MVRAIIMYLSLLIFQGIWYCLCSLWCIMKTTTFVLSRPYSNLCKLLCTSDNIGQQPRYIIYSCIFTSCLFINTVDLKTIATDIQCIILHNWPVRYNTLNQYTCVYYFIRTNVVKQFYNGVLSCHILIIEGRTLHYFVVLPF